MIKTNLELAAAAINCAKNYKTLYVNGCFGAPMNKSNKQRYCNNTSYNKKPERTAMIQAASEDTFGFDCVCLVKGLLWGWCGDKTKTYGGASYASNGVPDLSEEQMLNKCSDISTDFSNIEVGEYLWMQGHAGIYVGNGLSVECTPSWTNNVQFTACNRNISGYHRRNWTKHGKLPYITYIAKEQKPKEPYTQEQFIKDVQKILNKPQTGVADEALLNATVTLSENINSNHALVVPVQKWLFALGYTVVGEADGDAGPKFTEAVKAYQKTSNGSVDGEITAKEKTWKRLLNYTPHVCKYTSKITTAATCTKKGIKTFTCSCGKSYTEEIPMIAHSYTKKIIAPTCEKDGYTINTCSCGHSFNSDTTKAIGHNYIIDIIAPTYEEKGYNLNTCRNCGNKYQDNWVDCLVKEEKPEIAPVPETKPEVIEPNPAPEVKPQPIPTTPPAIEKSQWNIGDEGKIIAGARFATGKEILSWIVANKVYIREFRENESAVISTQKTGPITGIVYLKDLIPYSKDIYDVSVTSNLLNVRKEPKANATIINQIKKDTKHTIIEEKNGCGHIVNSGWINLQYVKKV